jgi:hypothetical protein
LQQPAEYATKSIHGWTSWFILVQGAKLFQRSLPQNPEKVFGIGFAIGGKARPENIGVETSQKT